MLVSFFHVNGRRFHVGLDRIDHFSLGTGKGEIITSVAVGVAMEARGGNVQLYMARKMERLCFTSSGGGGDFGAFDRVNHLERQSGRDTVRYSPAETEIETDRDTDRHTN